MINTIVRTTLCFFILLILTRFLGIKQMSQMTFFHYVTGITIGSITSTIVLSNSNLLSEELLSLICWCMLTILLARITLKSPKLKEFLDGQPIILIKDGQINKQSLKKTRISLKDLCIMLREQNIFSILEVDYAILEPNGKLSVLKNQDFLSPTKKQLGIESVKSKYFPTQLVIDGHIMYKNLKEINLSLDWLKEQLKFYEITTIKEVLYAEIQSDGSLYIFLYND